MANDLSRKTLMADYSEIMEIVFDLFGEWHPLLKEYYIKQNLDAHNHTRYTYSYLPMKRKQFKEELKQKAERLKELRRGNTDSSPIEMCSLCRRTKNALINNGVETVEQLLETSPSKIATFRGIGIKAVQELALLFGIKIPADKLN